MNSQGGPKRFYGRIVRLLAGPFCALLLYTILTLLVPNLRHEARATAALALWMGIWWMTEALPLEATGLLPIALFPILRIGDLRQTCAPYAEDVIFLFLGGMMLGVGLERTGLHRRFALSVVRVIGSSPTRLVGGFLLAPAFLSMWVSNAASTVMMLPIATSVCALISRARGINKEAHDPTEAAMLLAIAFGASIGGVGTLIGTPPMAMMAGFLRNELRASVSFADWLLVGLPVIAIMLPLTWLVLTRVAFTLPRGKVPGVHEMVVSEWRALGPMRWPEWVALCVFLLAVASWISAKTLGVGDATIAVIAALLLFIIPRDSTFKRAVLTWDDASSLPWGVLVMFGGGLSLAAAISRNGLDKAIADAAGGLAGAHLLLTLFVIAAGALILTELCSNTALVAAGLPVMAALSTALGVPPVPAIVTLSLAASLGFMLPAGTAPNALVFATGRMTIRQMMHAGLWLDICCMASVPPLVYMLFKAGWLPGH